ncbi:hypothetical protein VTK56DRAFT_6848 [Thermocarpiscus australiensis]
MDQAGLSVESGPRDHPLRDYQSEFNSHVDGDDDGLDFRLDAAYDKIEHAISGSTDEATALSVDDEIGYEEEEAQADNAGREQTEATELAQDAASNAEAEVEYQDEIGYEDDDFVTADKADLGSTEVAGTDSGLSNALSDGRPGSPQSADDSHAELLAQENDAAMHQGLEFEEHVDSTDLQGDFPDVGDDGGNEIVHNEEFHSDLSELDEEREDLINVPTEVPDIEVVYNDTSYSLLGTPDEDPDSYFLSDAKELDRPLAEFLSSLRAVISNEISPTDELVIRFEPLDLEFGERSNDKFLSRSFREILDCHAALASKQESISPEPVIHLLVRRDIEEHFLELLASAELGDDWASHSQHTGTPSSQADEPGGSLDDDGQVKNALSEDRYSGEHHTNVEETAEITGHDHAAADHAIGQDMSGIEAAPDDGDVAEEQEYTFESKASGPQSPSLAADDRQGEQNLDIEYSEAQIFTYEQTPVAANEWQDWTEPAGKNGATISEHDDLAPETSDQPTDHRDVHQVSNESGEPTGFSAADGNTTLVDDGSGQGMESNGDDLLLAFDDENHSSTARDEGDEYEEYALDTTEYVAGDAEDIQDMQEPHDPGETSDLTSRNAQIEAHIAAVPDAASSHTSTTYDGDETNYEEQHAGGGSATPADNSAPQSVMAPGSENDEIDWENDGDEYEQVPVHADESIDYEEQKEATLTPSSVAGKRSRADEVESLADETDYKRRRT